MTGMCLKMIATLLLPASRPQSHTLPPQGGGGIKIFQRNARLPLRVKHTTKITSKSITTLVHLC
jgi:hypothetical protein